MTRIIIILVTKKTLLSQHHEIDTERKSGAPAREKFKRRRTIIKGLEDFWHCYLADFQSYSWHNKGFKYILVVIVCYSKFMWTKPL